MSRFLKIRLIDVSVAAPFLCVYFLATIPSVFSYLILGIHTAPEDWSATLTDAILLNRSKSCVVAEMRKSQQKWGTSVLE